MEIKIDERVINVSNPELNIVQIARVNGINIPAPCYDDNRKFDCCNVCAIETDEVMQYACCTKPKDGMKIIFDRDDLNKLRRNKMKEYNYNKENNIKKGCSCSESCCESECDCN